MKIVEISYLLLPWIKTNYQHKITGIECDSRLIKPKNLFCAIQGEKFHGKKFILNSIHNGASIVIQDTKKK